MAASPAARPDAIRRHNLALVLGHIHRDGALTRAELTSRLRVSRSTMGALVADLLELGLVGEVVPGSGAANGAVVGSAGGVGRPSHVVGPHESGPYVAAVDVDVTHVVTAAVGLGGEVLARHELAADTADSSTGGSVVADPATAVRLVVESVGRVAEATGRGRPPTAVGVSVPGTVDRVTGQVTVAPNLDWHDVPFAAMLTDALAVALPQTGPVRLGNDADLAVIAEHLRGSARGFDDVVYLLGRVGVGAGIVVNGRTLHGRDGSAGEIGHNVIDSSGAACHCGKRGCTETFIGENALLTAAGRPLPPTDHAVAALFADARAGDVRARQAVNAMADPLGFTIASLVNTLNPQRVLLGGMLSQVLDLARDGIERSLAHYVLAVPGRSVELAQPAFGDDSPLLGAAELAFGELLGDAGLATIN